MKKNRFTSILVTIILFFCLLSSILASSIITDDFFDISKIAYSSNINFNTTLGYAELKNKTVSEMETPYNSSGLVAHYHLNDFTHTSNDNRTNVAKGNITDSSGNNNHGDFFHVNQDQLKAWYGFEDGNASTTITDLSGNGNTGTWSGKASGDMNVTESYDGLRDAGYFDGVNDSVSVNDDVSLNFVSDFSLVVWFKTLGNFIEQDERLIAKRTASVGYELYIMCDGGLSDGKMVLFIGDSEGYITHSTDDNTLKNGEWRFLVCVRDGDRIIFYVDGNLDSDVSTIADGDLSNVQNLYLGKYAGDIRWFNGSMDGVRLYNRALSQNEIEADYQQWIQGKLNQALSFDGVNTYVDVRDDSSLNFGIDSFSVIVWIKTSTEEPYHVILSRRHQSVSPWMGWDLTIWNSVGKILGTLRDSEGDEITALSSTLINNGEWHQVGMVINRDTQEIKIIIDGAFNGSTGDITDIGSVDIAIDLIIGATAFTQTYFWNGSIDEVRIYNRALSETEIKENYETYYSSGFFYSINLLKDQNATDIEAFSYNVSIDGDEPIELQFSQDNYTWFNSDGIENGFESCSNGSHIINLKGLAWSGNFYYRSNFTRGSTPKVYQIQIIYYYPMWSEIFTEFLYGSGAWLGLTVILTLMIIATAINRWASLLFLPVTVFMGIAYLMNVPVDSNFLWGALIMFMGSIYCVILPIKKLKG